MWAVWCLCERPERSYRRWQQREREGRPVKGPWPAPSADRVEPVAVEYANRLPAWAHRKVAMLMRVDGHHAPDSTVLRALERTGRVLPVGLPGRASPARQGATSGVRGGADWPESSLAARLHRVRDPPRRHLADRGRPLRELLVDPVSGEIRPITLATDNGPCFKAARFAAYIEKRPELIHIRTRRNSPNQNGVRERAFGSLKYEHLYRHEIDNSFDLGLEVESYRQLFNQIRPHEGIEMRRPPDVHLEATNNHQAIRARTPATFVKRDTGALLGPSQKRRVGGVAGVVAATAPAPRSAV